MSTWAILAAAGAGSRAGSADLPKQFWVVQGIPVLVRAARPFQTSERIEGIVVLAPAEHLALARQLIASHGLTKAMVIAGGAQRAESVKIGLDALPASCTVVAVHDAARPFVQLSWIEQVVAAAAEHGAALLAIPVSDTLKRVEEQGTSCVETVPREGLWAAQTPQAFRRDLLDRAMTGDGENTRMATDEAALVEALGHRPVIVQGDRRNLKLTGPEDRETAAALASLLDRRGGPALETSASEVRVGSGFDAHRFASDRPLVLGGVRFREQDGLLGHSDADVLTHAVTDALLGAVGAGDLGQHFPDTDARYKDACSLDLLGQAVRLAADRGFRVRNCDVTVLAEEPRLGPRRDEIRENLARALGVETDDVSVKASTTEGMGFVGRREGIAALATLLVGLANEKRDLR